MCLLFSILSFFFTLAFKCTCLVLKNCVVHIKILNISQTWEFWVTIRIIQYFLKKIFIHCQRQNNSCLCRYEGDEEKIVSFCNKRTYLLNPPHNFPVHSFADLAQQLEILTLLTWQVAPKKSNLIWILKQFSQATLNALLQGSDLNRPTHRAGFSALPPAGGWTGFHTSSPVWMRGTEVMTSVKHGIVHTQFAVMCMLGQSHCSGHHSFQKRANCLLGGGVRHLSEHIYHLTPAIRNRFIS